MFQLFGNFTSAEAGSDAHLHVMAGDVIDEWMQQRAEKRRHSRAVRFVDNERLEAFTEPPQSLQVIALEVVQEQIRNQHAAGWRRLLENVAAAPIDGRIQSGRARREIASGHTAIRKPALDFRGQSAVTRAQFTNPARGRTRNSSEGPEDPALIAHEEIDAPQVETRAPRGRIVVRQLVEDFGLDDAGFHDSSPCHLPQQEPISWKQDSHQATELMTTAAGLPQTAQGVISGSSCMPESGTSAARPQCQTRSRRIFYH